MNNVKELKDQYGSIYPGFGSYTECMSRALLTGFSSSILGNDSIKSDLNVDLISLNRIGFASAYTAQHLLKKSLPYSFKGNILVSSLVAVIVGFQVTAVRSRSCQAAWLAAEEKHTYLMQNETSNN